MPVVWAANALGADLQDRVYGPELMLRYSERCERVGVAGSGGHQRNLGPSSDLCSHICHMHRRGFMASRDEPYALTVESVIQRQDLIA